MLLCGIVDELSKEAEAGALLSYFFCQATDLRINNATSVLRGLIYMLIDQQPSLLSHVQKKYDQGTETPFEGVNAWTALSMVAKAILQDTSLKSIYLIIDALDECTIDLPKLLDFIVQNLSVSPNIKLVVSSRNRLDIEEQIEEAGDKVRLCLELNAESISMAVRNYIQYKVVYLAQRKKYNDTVREAVIKHLISNAQDTFLWVALVCQHLENVLKWQTVAKLKSFPPGLDSLYKRMIAQVCSSDSADICKQILTSTAIVYRPITIKELTSLVEVPEDISNDLESLQDIVSLCGSFLTIRGGVVYFIHQSAKDYLLEKASEELFPFGKEKAHRVIFTRSLQVMSKTLRRDCYNIRAPGTSIDQVEPPNPDPLAVARYSCLYWVDHLLDCHSGEDAIKDPQDGGLVYSFLYHSFLYWLEALSLLKNVSDSIVMLRKLEYLQVRLSVLSCHFVKKIY